MALDLDVIDDKNPYTGAKAQLMSNLSIELNDIQPRSEKGNTAPQQKCFASGNTAVNTQIGFTALSHMRHPLSLKATLWLLVACSSCKNGYKRPHTSLTFTILLLSSSSQCRGINLPYEVDTEGGICWREIYSRPLLLIGFAW